MVCRNGNFSKEEKNLNLLGTKDGVTGDFRLDTREDDDLNITVTFKSCWNLGRKKNL